MYINSYKNISSDNLELSNPVNNLFYEIQAIEDIKNSLKRSAEEFEAKELLKKPNLVASNEVSQIIDKKIEFLEAQESSIKNDQFQKIIEELFPDELTNKEMTVESQFSEPFVLSSNFDQETHFQSPPSTDIISLAWSIVIIR